MMLVMICGVLFVVFILSLLFRNEPLFGRQLHYSYLPRNIAISLLDERYARGEIPKEEYVKMKEDLKR